MNKYERVPDKVVDLHGYTSAEAEIILNNIVNSGQYVHVRVVTGKGNHSAGEPVLRSFVRAYLQRRNIRYNQAKLHNGGEGALDVFL